MAGKLFVVSGLSGSGKTTIIDSLLEQIPNLKRVITCTTRSPRKGEVNNKDYKFFSKKEFEKFIEKNALAEYANVYGNYYGSLKKEIKDLLKIGDAIISVDVQGALTFKNIFPDSKLIFINVPSEKIKKRLIKRSTDSKKQIEKRLETSKKELFFKKEFDYVVENIDLEKAIKETKQIILN